MSDKLKNIIDQSKEYDQRQSEIDQLLTPYIVREIVLENLGQIKPQLQQPENRLIILTFSSTAALLRRIKKTVIEKPLSIDCVTIEKGRLMNPVSRVIASCDPSTQFCVMLTTILPLSLLGLGPDQMLTHTTTSFLLSAFL